MSKICIAVLFGGCSTEYGVSLQSAAAVLRHLDKSKYDVLPVGIDRAGHWLYYTGYLDGLLDGSWCDALDDCIPCAVSPNRGQPELILFGDEVERIPFDAAFPVLHGKNGEDGTVQGLLELAGVPVIGCGTLCSALCMDKDRAHKLAAPGGGGGARVGGVSPERISGRDLPGGGDAGLSPVCQARAGRIFLWRYQGAAAGRFGRCRAERLLSRQRGAAGRSGGGL